MRRVPALEGDQHDRRLWRRLPSRVGRMCRTMPANTPPDGMGQLWKVSVAGVEPDGVRPHFETVVPDDAVQTAMA